MTNDNISFKISYLVAEYFNVFLVYVEFKKSGKL
jgi:hypothetical protein